LFYQYCGDFVQTCLLPLSNMFLEYNRLVPYERVSTISKSVHFGEVSTLRRSVDTEYKHEKS